MLSATGNGGVAIELSVREEFEQSMPNLLRGSQTMPDRGFRAPALPLVYSLAFLGVLELEGYRADNGPGEKEFLLPATLWGKPDAIFVSFFQSAEEPLSVGMVSRAYVNLHPYRAPYKWSNHFCLPRRLRVMVVDADTRPLSCAVAER